MTGTDPAAPAVRLARPGEEALLRTIRLQALADAPDQFCGTLDDERVAPTATWTRWLETGATFFAELGGEPLGMARYAPDTEDPEAGFLFAMWVAPAARGQGLGDALIDAVVARGVASGAARLRLHVAEGNAPALALYERHGFRLTGEGFVLERTGTRELEMLRVLAGRREVRR